MELNEQQLSEKFASLAEPFPPEDVEWRINGTPNEQSGRGLVLAYITNRAVMERLDKVWGPQNWRNEYAAGPIGGIMCGIAIRINSEWITKYDGAEGTAVEQIKGGFSDSMKRAAVQWGIGRYLYGLGDTWVECEKKGKYWRIKDNKRPQLPAWALPAGYKAQKQQPVEKAPAAEKAPAPAAEKAPAQKPAEKPAVAAPAMLDRARGYMIPAGSGLPGAGKQTLGQKLEESEKLGTHVLRVLAGRTDGMNLKTTWAPKNPEEEKIRSAAAYLLDNLQAQAPAN